LAKTLREDMSAPEIINRRFVLVAIQRNTFKSWRESRIRRAGIVARLPLHCKRFTSLISWHSADFCAKNWLFYVTFCFCTQTFPKQQ
ncbi:hypothetical protein P4S70_21855, partial [Enterovibrio sp. Hal110]